MPRICVYSGSSFGASPEYATAAAYFAAACTRRGLGLVYGGGSAGLMGVLEEVIEIFTWLQLGLHLKPVGLLNVGGFYNPLLQLLDHMCDEQFLTPAHRAMLTVERESESLLDRLAAIKHLPIPKSIQR
jgi:predicted Rossmann-fold nucleotide-binding protein